MRHVFANDSLLSKECSSTYTDFIENNKKLAEFSLDTNTVVPPDISLKLSARQFCATFNHSIQLVERENSEKN